MRTTRCLICVFASAAVLSVALVTHHNRMHKTVLWHTPLPTPNLNHVTPWSGSPSSLDEIGFLIMTSSVTTDLHFAQRKTFLRGVRNVWAFADISAPFVLTLPSLKGQSTWHDAQHRQLRGMQYLAEKKLVPVDVSWVFFIDDDTWVNSFALRGFLRAFRPPPATFTCGYQFEANHMLNGGAGILMGRKLFDAVASKLYTSECPFKGTNDDTLTECVRTMPNATILHSELFSFYPTQIESTNDYMEKITLHPVKDPELMRQMTENAERFYRRKALVPSNNT